MVAAWAVDEHTIEAASQAVDLGFIKAVLVGDAALINEVCVKRGIDAAKFTIVDNPDELKAVAQAVQMVHDGEGDVLMKGLCLLTSSFAPYLTRRPVSFLLKAFSAT